MQQLGAAQRLTVQEGHFLQVKWGPPGDTGKPYHPAAPRNVLLLGTGLAEMQFIKTRSYQIRSGPYSNMAVVLTR